VVCIRGAGFNDVYGRNHLVKIIKRVLIIAVLAFAVFYLIMRPEEAATAVQTAIGAVWGAGEAVVNFFVALAG
jgi:uncharacterized membrane protein